MILNNNKALNQFLSQYSQAINLATWPADQQWDHILILPVCGEKTEFLSHLLKRQTQLSVLVIIVINRPGGHVQSSHWQAGNSRLIHHLKDQAKKITQLVDKHHLLIDCCGADVLLLDYNDEPFSAQQGVGLARRIAADTALALIANQVIRQPWIFSTDADVVLPDGYFTVIDDVPEKTVAICMEFEHVSDDAQLNEVQLQYDFKLRYYQQAVKFIGSEYHYIPLGSTLIVAATPYAKVRGFPRRSAGEDFYLLNKLAKLGTIAQPPRPVIEITARFSDRVPFGTGPAIAQIQSGIEDGAAYLYYHPEIFHILKAWRLSLLNYFETQKLPPDDHGLNDYWNLNPLLAKNWQQIKTKDRWSQFLHEWFDAFRILKSVHYLRREMVSVSYKELLHLQAYKSLSD